MMKAKKNANPSRIRKWWKRNQHIILRIVFFYIWIPSKIADRIWEYNYNKCVWSEEKAKRILDCTIPFFFDKDEKTGELSFPIRGRYNLAYQKGIKRKDKRFAKRYNEKIFQYLFSDYQIEGYEKTIAEFNFKNFVIFTKVS